MAGKPLPTNLKILRGNPGRRPLNKREPVPASGKPTAMDCLTPAAGVHFARLSVFLSAMRVLTEADQAALSALAQSLADYEEATRALTELGTVIESSRERGLVRSPWLIVRKQAWEQMQRGFSDFGLTPSARSKIQTLPASEPNDEARFFGS